MTVRGLNGVTGPPAHKVVGLEQIPGHARVQHLLEVHLINVEAMQVNRDYAILSYAQVRDVNTTRGSVFSLSWRAEMIKGKEYVFLSILLSFLDEQNNLPKYKHPDIPKYFS